MAYVSSKPIEQGFFWCAQWQQKKTTDLKIRSYIISQAATKHNECYILLFEMGKRKS
jgi:hypothetical protein